MTIRPTAPSLYTRPAAAPPAERPPEAARTAETAAGSISDAERRALAQQFPDKPALALRLYGPQRGVAPEPAAALGGRLDLRG